MLNVGPNKWVMTVCKNGVALEFLLIWSIMLGKWTFQWGIMVILASGVSSSLSVGSGDFDFDSRGGVEGLEKDGDFISDLEGFDGVGEAGGVGVTGVVGDVGDDEVVVEVVVGEVGEVEVEGLVLDTSAIILRLCGASLPDELTDVGSVLSVRSEMSWGLGVGRTCSEEGLGANVAL